MLIAKYSRGDSKNGIAEGLFEVIHTMEGVWNNRPIKIKEENGT